MCVKQTLYEDDRDVFYNAGWADATEKLHALFVGGLQSEDSFFMEWSYDNAQEHPRSSQDSWRDESCNYKLFLCNLKKSTRFPSVFLSVWIKRMSDMDRSVGNIFAQILFEKFQEVIVL